MEFKQIITATVAVILICLVAIPLIGSSSESIQTESQNTTEWFSMAASDEDVTIEFASSGVYILNGTPVDNPSSINWSVKCFAPEIIIKFNAASTGANAILSNKTTLDNISKIVYSNGNVEVTSNSGTTNIGVSFFYYMDPEGTWGMFEGRSLNPTHINIDQEYYVICQSSFVSNTGSYYSAFLYKNNELIDTVFNPIFTSTYNGELTDTTVDVTITKVDVDSKHFDITSMSNVTVNGDVTFSNTSAYIMAPINYMMISENDSIIITILDIIPILLISALLISIGYSIMRRD